MRSAIVLLLSLPWPLHVAVPQRKIRRFTRRLIETWVVTETIKGDTIPEIEYLAWFEQRLSWALILHPSLLQRPPRPGRLPRGLPFRGAKIFPRRRWRGYGCARPRRVYCFRSCAWK